MSNAISGAVARIKPFTSVVLNSSRRSAGFVRMYRQPSTRSAARSRGASARAGRGSLPPIARMPTAESR